MEKKTTRTHVVLPTTLLAEIDQEVGPRKRSEFITRVLEDQLERRRAAKRAERLLSIPPLTWSVPGLEGLTTDEAIRQLREEGEAALDEALNPRGERVVAADR